MNFFCLGTAIILCGVTAANHYVGHLDTTKLVHDADVCVDAESSKAPVPTTTLAHNIKGIADNERTLAMAP
jgi:hypothetical protein